MNELNKLKIDFEFFRDHHHEKKQKTKNKNLPALKEKNTSGKVHESKTKKYTQLMSHTPNIMSILL